MLLQEQQTYRGKNRGKYRSPELLRYLDDDDMKEMQKIRSDARKEREEKTLKKNQQAKEKEERQKEEEERAQRQEERAQRQEELIPYGMQEGMWRKYHTSKKAGDIRKILAKIFGLRLTIKSIVFEKRSYNVKFYIDEDNFLRYKLGITDVPDLSVGEEYQWDRQQNEKYLYAPNSKLQKVLELAVKELLDISDIRVKAGEIRTNLANTPNNQRTIESIQVEKHSYNVQFYIDKDKFLRYKLWKTTDPNWSVGEEYKWALQQDENYLYAPNSELKPVLELAAKKLLDTSSS